MPSPTATGILPRMGGNARRFVFGLYALLGVGIGGAAGAWLGWWINQQTGFSIPILLAGFVTALPGWLVGTWVQQRAAIAETTQQVIEDITRRLPKQPALPLLLRAQYETLPPQPYHDDLLADIDAWCHSPDPAAVRLYVGPGGIGKTRLFIRACQQRDGGWRAGFLTRRDDLLDSATLEAVLQGNRRLLIVVDYAETRRETVKRLLGRAAAPDRPGKLRIALIARSAAAWWDELRSADADTERLLSTAPAPISVPPLPPAAEDRKHVYAAAVTAFAKPLGKSASAAAMPPDLTAATLASILLVQIAALAALEGRRLDRAGDLLDFVIDREAEVWRRDAPDGLSGEAVAQAAAMMVLAGRAEGEAEAEAILAAAPRLRGQSPDTLRKVADLLRRRYPGRAWLEGLQPDLLGEHLVGRELARDPGLLPAFLDAAAREASAERAKGALTVLTRLARRDPTQTPWLQAALSGRLERLAAPVLAVAVETGAPYTGEPVVSTVWNTLSEAPTLETLQALDRELSEHYWTTVNLRELAAAVCKWLYWNICGLPDPQPEEVRVEHARLANNLSLRLRDLGRREDAIKASEEAVRLYRELAAARPEAFTPDLARSLNNLSNCLRDLGRREEALNASEEAVRLHRELAAAQPEAFTPDLARSLNNLSNRLSGLGRREDALNVSEEAVRLYRELAAARPEAFTPDLASSLNNLSIRLSALGRREDALKASEETVRLYRELAAARPEAFTPDLAGSLNNLSNRLSGLGRREDALKASEEAVRLYRELAAARPEAFTPDLAALLSNLSACLSDLGRREEAVDVIEEAVSLRRELAAARPEAFTPDLASSLGVHGHCLAGLGRAEAAAGASRKGVERLAPMFLALPAAFAPLMQGLVENYRWQCEAAGVAEDAAMLAPIVEVLERLEGDDGTLAAG